MMAMLCWRPAGMPVIATSFSILLPLTMSAKILFMYPHDSNSHLQSALLLIETLASDGHAVTVLHSGTRQTNEAIIANVSTELWALENVMDKVELLNIIVWNSNDHSDKHAIYLNVMEAYFTESLRQMPDKIQRFVSRDWDLIVCDGLFTIHGFAITQLLKRTRRIPYIIYDTTFVFQYQASALAFGGSWSAQVRMWSYFPYDSQDVYRPAELKSRLPNFLETFVEVFSMNSLLQWYNYDDIIKFIGRPFTMPLFMSSSSLLITDEIRGFGQVTPRTSRVQVFSSFCATPTELPLSLAEFVEDKKSKGTIYVAFGTMVQFDKAPPRARDEFFDALDALVDYRVVFATRTKSLRTFRDHVRVVEWAPQLALLHHPKTKVFVSHGGLKSFKEALCTRRPMAMLPFFAEQGRNAMVATKLGLATTLNRFTLEKNVIVAELLKVVEDESYAQRVSRLHDTFLDNPISHGDHIKFTISRILKQKGQHLRHEHRGETLSSFNFFHIDAILVALSIILAVSIQ